MACSDRDSVHAALFAEKYDDLFQHFVLRDAQQATTFPILLDQANRDQRGNVVAQGRCGNGELLLQVSNRQALLSRFDQMFENEQGTGALTPFCSCSTISMLRGLLSAKAGFGPTLTFLFVSPLLNPIIVGLMWATFGWKVTMLYALIAAGVSVLASMLLDMLGFERHIIDSKEASCGTGCGATASEPASVNATICCSSNAIKSVKPLKAQVSCCTSLPEAASTISCCADGTAARTQDPVIPTAFAKARIDAWQQFKEVLPYLLLGVLIGSFIYGFIPAVWIAAHAGADNPLAIPFSAIVGIPLYIRAEAVIPLGKVRISHQT